MQTHYIKNIVFALSKTWIVPFSIDAINEAIIGIKKYIRTGDEKCAHNEIKGNHKLNKQSAAYNIRLSSALYLPLLSQMSTRKIGFDFLIFFFNPKTKFTGVGVFHGRLGVCLWLANCNVNNFFKWKKAAQELIIKWETLQRLL